jgi:hypothetical protein
MAVRHLEISHEWGSFAVRDVTTGDRIDPASLPIPESVCTRLNRWSDRWDVTFDVHDASAPKVDEWVLQELGLEGARLWRAVLGSLSPQEYDVVYRHEDTLYRAPTELPDAWRLA